MAGLCFECGKRKLGRPRSRWLKNKKIERKVEAKEEAFTVKGSKALKGPQTQGIQNCL
jgi:hypothetical protein